MSNAWKAHEGRTAKILGGTRNLRGADFSQSLPDVVAPLSFFGNYNGTILAECKYSKYQPWMDWFFKQESYFTYPRTLFIDYEDIDYTLFELVEDIDDKFLPRVAECYMVSDTKRVPGYIQDYLTQSEEYFGKDEYDAPHLPLVVLGKKNSKRKLAICKSQYIVDIVDNDINNRSSKE